MRKYYRFKKSLRQMQLNKAFVFFSLFIIILLLSIFFMIRRAIPVITNLCKYNARYIALNVTNEAVNETIKDITYDNLVNLIKDENGKIVAINANVMELNRLSTIVSSKVAEKLNNIEDRYLKVPISSIFHLGMFSGFGPRIKLKVIPTGNVVATFKSEFEDAGINQTRHNIYIEVKTKVRLVAPLYTSSEEYINTITVAETVIIGDIPGTYYNIKGVEGLDKKDTLNMFE